MACLYYVWVNTLNDTLNIEEQRMVLINQRVAKKKKNDIIDNADDTKMFLNQTKWGISP